MIREQQNLDQDDYGGYDSEYDDEYWKNTKYWADFLPSKIKFINFKLKLRKIIKQEK